MRREDVASTLIRRHFGTKCPLGRCSQGQSDQDIHFPPVLLRLLDALLNRKIRKMFHFQNNLIMVINIGVPIFFNFYDKN